MPASATLSLRLPGAGLPGPKDAHMTDRELVKGMIEGDEEAFDLFSETFIPALYRFAFFRLNRDRELTSDIVQNTVCKAIAKIRTFRGEAALMTWLCACCRTEIAMHFRSEGRRPQGVEWTEDTAGEAGGTLHRGQPEAETRVLRKEKYVRVHAALELLSTRYRQVLTWKYLEDLSVKEIAGRLEVSPKAAESVLTRARQAFRNTHESVQDASLFPGIAPAK